MAAFAAKEITLLEKQKEVAQITHRGTRHDVSVAKWRHSVSK